MTPVFRKQEVKRLAHLQALVAENAEAIEPGLRVLAHSLNLGRSTVDLVGLDARQTPVLIALGFVADDQMLFRMLEAYAWCLEYPESVRRLVPAEDGAGQWPPRVVFVGERVLESFQRRIRLLKFPAVACFEFRCVEVNGATGFYLEAVDWATPRRDDLVATPSEPGSVEVAHAPAPASAEPELPANPELGPTWRKFLEILTGTLEGRPAQPDAPQTDPAPTPTLPIDETKLGAVKEYLRREFPLCTIYDFHEFERSAQVFQLQDNHGQVSQLATITADFFEARHDSEICPWLEEQKLARALRQAGQAGVLVTNAGLQLEKR